jgi:hypothetical protein
VLVAATALELVLESYGAYQAMALEHGMPSGLHVVESSCGATAETPSEDWSPETIERSVPRTESRLPPLVPLQ